MNIWDEDDAAARVRRHHDGLETVPTVVTADGHFVAKDRQTFQRAVAVVGQARPVG